MRSIVLSSLVLAVVTAPAHADPKADVTAAFTQFVDGVAAGTAPSDLEMFIGPMFSFDPVPPLERTREVVSAPKVSGVKVVVSAGGKSAWLVADIAGAKVPHWDNKAGKDVTKAEKLRASAFLASADGSSWHVVAAHWSAGVPNVKSEMCGDGSSNWQIDGHIPADAADAVNPVVDALKAGSIEGGLWKLMSDAKTGIVIGSAPKERWASPKAKKLFKKFMLGVEITADDGTPPVRAGLGPDGEMAWMALAVTTGMELCTTYRAFYVLAKEKDGWRIVHQHYSEPVGPRNE